MKYFLFLFLFIVSGSYANFIDVANYSKEAQKRAFFINKKKEEFKSLPKLSQLEEVNAFFNKSIKYKSDLDLWNKKDYKASLKETIEKGMLGDCEEYVLAKSEALIYLGFDLSEARVVISTENGIAHMKLFVKVDGTIYVLDNLNKEFKAATMQENVDRMYSVNSLIKIVRS